MCQSVSRSLRQEELDAYFREEFINAVLSAVAPAGFMQQGRTVRFLIHKQNWSLVVIEQKGAGEWEFSIADNYRYTYHLSRLIGVLEQIYASGAEVIALKGEAQISATHRKANPDAEPDTPEGDDDKLPPGITCSKCGLVIWPASPDGRSFEVVCSECKCKAAAQ